MYDATEDPYCYNSTTVLKNLAGLRDQTTLDEFEKRMTAQRSEEPFPSGRLSASHYRGIHHHLFQDVYVWAGRSRTVRMSKDGSAFCYPEHISREMDRLFAALSAQQYLRGLSRDGFAPAGAEDRPSRSNSRKSSSASGLSSVPSIALIFAKPCRPIVTALVGRRFEVWVVFTVGAIVFMFWIL